MKKKPIQKLHLGKQTLQNLHYRQQSALKGGGTWVSCEGLCISQWDCTASPTCYSCYECLSIDRPCLVTVLPTDCQSIIECNPPW